MGYGNTPLIYRLTKNAISIIARPLPNLFNCSLFLNTYPNSWKYDQFTPTCKRGVEYSKLNYRPINILVAFDSIFERILASQVNIYFADKLSLLNLHIVNIIAVRLLYYVSLKISDLRLTSKNFHP